MLIGATLNLRADQPGDSLDWIFSSGDLMDLLKYAEQHKDPADQQIIFKRLKGKIDTGQAAAVYSGTSRLVSAELPAASGEGAGASCSRRELPGEWAPKRKPETL
jgi:hypothetical protein